MRYLLVVILESGISFLFLFDNVLLLFDEMPSKNGFVPGKLFPYVILVDEG